MIEGVAIKSKTVIIKLPKPNRHCDCYDHARRIGIDCFKAGIGIKAKDQGFYTTSGKYLNREQAFKYAKKIKQPLLDNPHMALCSENLWQH